MPRPVETPEMRAAVAKHGAVCFICRVGPLPLYALRLAPFDDVGKDLRPACAPCAKVRAAMPGPLAAFAAWQALELKRHLAAIEMLVPSESRSAGRPPVAKPPTAKEDKAALTAVKQAFNALSPRDKAETYAGSEFEAYQKQRKAEDPTYQDVWDRMKGHGFTTLLELFEDDADAFEAAAQQPPPLLDGEPWVDRPLGQHPKPEQRNAAGQLVSAGPAKSMDDILKDWGDD